MRTFWISLTLFLAAHVADGAWIRVTKAPDDVRGIVARADSSVTGFTATGESQSVFWISRAGERTAVSLDLSPEFYAYAHDVAGSRLCLVSRLGSGTRRMICHGAAPRQIETSAFPLPMISGAFVDSDTLWIVDPSPASLQKPLVRLRRAGTAWIEEQRVASPLCRSNELALTCSELEIHPGDGRRLGLVPLLGRLEADVFRYPDIAVWDYERGTMTRIKLPSVPVPQPWRQQYKNAGAIRLIYRSASSIGGRIAVIPVLPSDEKQGIKRDQLWLYDLHGAWKRLSAPAAVNAVTFVGEEVFIGTARGDIWRWAD